jgi:hypothetical protein
MVKKVSACRVEVRVIYHCNFGNLCDFFERNYANTGLCANLHVEDSTCTLRAAQGAGRQQSRRRA